MYQSLKKHLEISEPLYAESSLVNLVVEQFVLTYDKSAPFRESVHEFDSFFHTKMLRQPPHLGSPRFKIAHHSTDTELVVDYPGSAGLASIISSAFSALALKSGYVADIEQRTVMTIHGTAVRFLITLTTRAQSSFNC